MVNYLDDRKLKKDLDIALKLEKLESDNRKTRKETRMNELTYQEANAIAFKPITEAVMSLAEAVKPRPKGEQMLAIEAPPSLEMIKGANELEKVPEVTNVSDSTLSRTISEIGSEGSLYGLRFYSGKAFMNGIPIEIKGDEITVKDKTYRMTPGLAHLLVTDKQPANDGLISSNDVSDYLDMTIDTRINIKPSSNKYKKQIMKYYKLQNGNYVPTEEAHKDYDRRYVGKGIRFLPSNTLSLRDMLGLRLAAYKAGNTGLRKKNEIIAISDELLRQKAIKKSDYKKMMTKLT